MHRYVSAEARVGPRAQIGWNVVIGPNVTIGADVVIKSGAVIGELGFGYERDEDGRWVLKEHTHRVSIEDDVHIGANTCIDQGSWRDTSIGRGARIDNLVHIAHNALIGEGAVIVAQAEISGSVIVGTGAWVGPRACIRQRLSIGPRALVGIGAVVLEDVPGDQTWAGVPARCINADVGVREDM